jgi:hypothetical protein
MKAWSAVGIAVAVSIAIGAAAPAVCDGPQIGSGCLSSQVNSTTPSSTGTTIRCLADLQQGYIWMIDTGKTQDPWIADQMAWPACHQQGHTDAQCRTILDGT